MMIPGFGSMGVGVRKREAITKQRGKSSKREGGGAANIFARISSPTNAQSQVNPTANLGGGRKKRNLFLSENIGVEEEDGIPEEHIEIQQ